MTPSFGDHLVDYHLMYIGERHATMQLKKQNDELASRFNRFVPGILPYLKVQGHVA